MEDLGAREPNTAAMDERSERVAKRFELPLLIAALLVIPLLIIDQAECGCSA
jgi:hypothetical protein